MLDPYTTHPKFKFFVEYAYDVVIENATVWEYPVPDKATDIELSKEVPWYIPQDEK